MYELYDSVLSNNYKPPLSYTHRYIIWTIQISFQNFLILVDFNAKLTHLLRSDESHPLLMLLPETISITNLIPINVITCPTIKTILFRKKVVLELISWSSNRSADLCSSPLIRLRFNIVLANNIPKTIKCIVIHERIQYFGLGQ